MQAMNQKRQNILHIQYHIQKGLTFNWNLGGLLSKGIYFRHLFILASENHTFFESISRLLCCKIKTGDLIAFFCKWKTQMHQPLDWFEKTSLGFDNSKIKNINKVPIKDLLLALPTIGNETRAYSNPVLVNIFIENMEEIPNIKSIINKLRIDGLFPYHVNFFGNFSYHDISTPTGFNQINTTEDNLSEVAKIYKSLSLETAVENIQLDLDCHNVQLSLRKNSIWESVDFGRVRRHFYGPSIHYKQDCISFLDEALSKKGGDVSMIISLKITLLSGMILNAQKSFTLTTQNLRLFGMTLCENNQPRSTYEFSKIIRSKTQPYCSNSSLVIAKFIPSEENFESQYGDQ